MATRYLAALGADVLRVDPPHRPELPVHRYDGLPGKRSTILDARTPDGLARLHQLLHGAAGPVTTVTPPGVLDGRALAWPPRLTTYGQDAPAWEASAWDPA